MAKVYFSTGSNEGDRLNSLVEAAKLIEKQIGTIIDLSPVVESEPMGFVSETNFYNQVLLVETNLMPQQIIKIVLEIEAGMGRVRSGKSYISRIIDIDILFYDDILFSDGDLVIPHRRLHERNFVMQPLMTIAPLYIHPLLKISITELLRISVDKSLVFTVVEKNDFMQCMTY